MNEGWGERVTVMLHRVPESEEYEGGFEAVTMTGVPYNVSVTGSDHNSPEDALNHLISGLNAFGFSGCVAVEDTTYIGGVQRYKVQAG